MIMNARFFLVVLVGLFGGCGQPEVEISSTEDFRLFISEEMEEQHIPAAAVLVFKADELLYEAYFGYANVEQQIALKADHLFLMASVSKVVTATALLRLYDEGRFDLDDPINDHLPFGVQVPGYAQAITFRMLLTHTAGIADNWDVLDGQYYYDRDPPVALSDFVENYLVPGGAHYDARGNYHDFEPGTEHEYSNVGSALIAVLVESISGLDFDSYCKQYIFTPLGMRHTFWRLEGIQQTMVTPYDDIDGENIPLRQYTNTDYPNGGLRTTAQDMWQLLSALANDGQSAGYRLLEAATVRAMITPQIPSIDPTVGLHMFSFDEANLWGHDGGEQGVATIMAFDPANKTGAIVLTNQGEADVEDILIKAYQLGLVLQ